MNWDTLVYWMSHVREGSWSSFRAAVAKLAPADADPDDLSRSMRLCLSDLGYADFFLSETQRWRMLRPALGPLSGCSDTAYLAGARTPDLLDRLSAAAEGLGCEVDRSVAGGGPARLVVRGTTDALKAAAESASVAWVQDPALDCLTGFRNLRREYESARPVAPPLNWTAHSFDLRRLQWIDDALPRAACEFVSRYGARLHFVRDNRGALRAMRRREAVHASAMLHGLSLGQYAVSGARLTAPVQAPLPEVLARSACLCSGRLPRVQDGQYIFENVPFRVGAAVLVLLGQPHPGFQRCKDLVAE